MYCNAHLKYWYVWKLVTIDSFSFIIQINAEGYAYAVGRRKTSMAQVWLKKGGEKITVNGKDFIEFFPKIEDRYYWYGRIGVTAFDYSVP